MPPPGDQLSLPPLPAATTARRLQARPLDGSPAHRAGALAVGSSACQAFFKVGGARRGGWRAGVHRAAARGHLQPAGYEKNAAHVCMTRNSSAGRRQEFCVRRQVRPNIMLVQCGSLFSACLRLACNFTFDPEGARSFSSAYQAASLLPWAPAAMWRMCCGLLVAALTCRTTVVQCLELDPKLRTHAFYYAWCAAGCRRLPPPPPLPPLPLLATLDERKGGAGATHSHELV